MTMTKTSAAPSRWIEYAITPALAVLLALAIWWAFPPSPVAFNDDFGYFRSIVQTIQHGRPWTDDWLEPWAASLSTLAAAIFAVTGDFRAATYGLHAALVGVILWFGVRLLRGRGVPWPVAALWVLVALTSPTLLKKIMEFGAVPLYVAALFGAIWSAERKTWWLFGLCWFVGFTSRQNAILWLALPVGALIESNIRVRAQWPMACLKIAGISVAGLFTLWFVSRAMNVSYAQTTTIPQLKDRLSPSLFFPGVGVTLAVYAAAVGLGSFISIVGTGRWLHRSWKARLFAVVGSLAAASLWFPKVRELVVIENLLPTEHAGNVSLATLGVLSILGWIIGAPLIRFPYLICGLATAALMGLRPFLWDYYLIDTVAFGALGIAIPPAAEFRYSRLLMALGAAISVSVAGTLLWFHSGFVVTAKNQLNGNYARMVLTERALRDGQLDITEITAAPFGVKGWHLYPYMIANDPVPGRAISYFRFYASEGASWCRSGPPDSPAPTNENQKLKKEEVIVASDLFPDGWRSRARYTLYKSKNYSPAPAALDRAKYSYDPFPLTKDEWRTYIRSKH